MIRAMRRFSCLIAIVSSIVTVILLARTCVLYLRGDFYGTWATSLIAVVSLVGTVCAWVMYLDAPPRR